MGTQCWSRVIGTSTSANRLLLSSKVEDKHTCNLRLQFWKDILKLHRILYISRTYIILFRVALFVIATNCKQSSGPSIIELIHKL